MTHALITGFAGMVGSHLADHLLRETDWHLIGFVRWNEDMRNVSHLAGQINDPGGRVSLVYGDMNDMASLNRAIAYEPQHVFHLAAQSFPKTSFDSPIETLQTNIIGTANLLEAIRHSHKFTSSRSPVQVHVCSSSEIFGRVPQDQLPIDENAAMHPASPYAISKVGTDLLGRMYAEAYGMHVVVTRMFTHTGPRRGDVFAESTFAKQIAMIEQGYAEPVVKTGNLDSLRTWSDVRDAVRAYHMLMSMGIARQHPGECFNIGGDHVCTVGEMLEHLISISTKRDKITIEMDVERYRPIDADLQVPDTSKFREYTGWEPEISFAQTMEDLLDYWRERVRSSRGKELLR